MSKRDPQLTVEVVELTELELDPANVRRHGPRNLEAIAESLSRFGLRRPLVVHGSTVIAGNGTLEAARALGWKNITISRVPEEWTVEQARAYAIADNRTAELAEWDKVELLDQLEGMSLELLGSTGFDAVDIEDLRQVWGAPPDLDSLGDEIGDPTDEDGLVTVRMKLPPDIAAKWEAACKATGLQGVEAQALAIQAAFDALTDGTI
jgi:hypothetical protein